MSQDINRICEILAKHDKILLLTHKNPDGDAVGSTCALAHILRKIGKQVKILFPEEPMERLRFILGDLDYYPDKRDNDFTPDLIVCLDCASSSRLGVLEEEFSHTVDVSIDHHISGKEFAKYTYTRADASATSEIIYDIAQELVKNKVIDTLDSDISYPLYAGIASDTGNFKYSNTTPHTLNVCAELLKTGIDAGEISRLLFDSFSLNKLKAEALGVQKLELFAHGKAAIICIPKELLEAYGLSYEDFDDVVNVARKVDGVEIGAYVRVSDNGDYKISLRANSYADVAAICAKHSGGGHLRAAGCSITATSIEKAAEIIKKDIEEALNQ